MRGIILTLFSLVCNLVFSQSTYTGYFYSPQLQGMHTDDWFNLMPNSGAAASNSWNVYHKDGGSIFQVQFGASQPSVQIGAQRFTDLAVNGNIQTTGNISLPLQASLGYVITQDQFPHNGNNVGNYSLKWCFDSWQPGAPSGYLSAFGGLKFFTDGKVQVAVTKTGNVGIGTTDPGSFKLAVNGKIWSQEVNIAMTNPGPDYVFEKDYNLLSLAELEAYIKANKHLPEVPSAKQMEADGLNLKEMNLILLKKVEELTLHLIEANKKIEETNEKVKVLEKKVARNQK